MASNAQRAAAARREAENAELEFVKEISINKLLTYEPESQKAKNERVRRLFRELPRRQAMAISHLLPNKGPRKLKHPVSTFKEIGQATQKSKKKGYLELILGPMFSGKT